MRYATIGGQAVIEGVMMRNGNDYAVAVRKPDQTIEVKKDQYIGLNARWHTKKIPIIRGVLSFIDSLVLGMSTLTYSASFFEDEEEAEKEKDKDGKYIRKERYSGSCSRSFYVGDAVTQDDVKAKFENGVLTLEVPKKEEAPKVEEKKYISIEG